MNSPDTHSGLVLGEGPRAPGARTPSATGSFDTADLREEPVPPASAQPAPSGGLACSPYLARSTRTAELADAMFELVTADGCATEADLAARGFTAAEIVRHGEAARKIVKARTAGREVTRPRRARVGSLVRLVRGKNTGRPARVEAVLPEGDYAGERSLEVRFADGGGMTGPESAFELLAEPADA